MTSGADDRDSTATPARAILGDFAALLARIALWSFAASVAASILVLLAA
jgi:hypothetical protein